MEWTTPEIRLMEFQAEMFLAGCICGCHGGAGAGSGN
jgi:hypothetical protein